MFEFVIEKFLNILLTETVRISYCPDNKSPDKRISTVLSILFYSDITNSPVLLNFELFVTFFVLALVQRAIRKL